MDELCYEKTHVYRSRSARSAWIEIKELPVNRAFADGRAPLGARGLKSDAPHAHTTSCGRAPLGARGLKLITRACSQNCMSSGRAPLGARGLKCYCGICRTHQSRRRAPLGARGLKLPGLTTTTSQSRSSRSARSAWIEIFIIIR